MNAGSRSRGRAPAPVSAAEDEALRILDIQAIWRDVQVSDVIRLDVVERIYLPFLRPDRKLRGAKPNDVAVCRLDRNLCCRLLRRRLLALRLREKLREDYGMVHGRVARRVHQSCLAASDLPQNLRHRRI
jgi:hypothetical protein